MVVAILPPPSMVREQSACELILADYHDAALYYEREIARMQQVLNWIYDGIDELEWRAETIGEGS